jgi:hypothetical protein
MTQASSKTVLLASETYVDFQWTSQRYVPGDRTLLNHRYEMLSAATKKDECGSHLCALCCIVVVLSTSQNDIFLFPTVNFQSFFGRVALFSSLGALWRYSYIAVRRRAT